MKKHLYILVADSGRAKVYQAETPLARLDVVYDQVNFMGRKKASEVYSDKPGRQQTDRGGYHGFADGEDVHGEKRFSRELCHFLCEAHKAGKFDNLILVAPPHFLGVLRKELAGECGDVLLCTVDKDLVKMPGEAIIGTILSENPGLNLTVL